MARPAKAMPETTKEIKITETEKVSIIFLPFVSDIVSRNKLANVGDQSIPNLIGFLDHLRITFIPRKLHSFIDNLERVHRDDVVELFGESGFVRHADLVAGDR